MSYCDNDAALPSILQVPQPVQRGTRHSLTEIWWHGGRIDQNGIVCCLDRAEGLLFFVSINMFVLWTCLEDAMQQHGIIRKHRQVAKMQ